MSVSWGQNSSAAALPKRYNNKPAALGNVRGQAAKAAATGAAVQQTTAAMGGMSLGSAAAPALQAQPSVMSSLTSALGSWNPFKGGRTKRRRNRRRRSHRRR